MESTVINEPQENPNPTGSNNTAAQAHVGVGDQTPSGGGGVHQQNPENIVHHNEDPNHPQQRFRSEQNPFFFDMDDPRDFFTNPALRTRLSRPHNPWNSMFGQRKRRTSPPSSAGVGGAAEPHRATADPYHDDFFSSHFDAPHWNEPRGWPPMNGARKRMQEHPERGAKSNADMFNYIPEEFRQYMPGFQQHHRQPQSPSHPPPQPHQPPQSPQQQPYAQRNNSGDLRRPLFCDAAMQTDDITPSGSGGNIHENEQQQPSHSEPPPPPPRGNASRSAGGGDRRTADTGSGNSPNGSFASANAYASTGSAGCDAGGQREARSNSNSMGNVRRVPIIVEGTPSSFPKESYMPHRSPPNRQSAPQPETHQAPPTRERPAPPQAREVPIQRPTEPPSPSVESINKIQDIQQDVLDLMFKVEQYQGTGNKNDKEYKYLDEMLTRNLLKLDTIDTRGNDSIRLARKEAIKCIQASLSVLEAKVAPPSESKGEGSAQSGSAEKEENQTQATEEMDKSKIPIPLPPIPGQVPPPTIRDCNSDDEGDAPPPVYVTEKTVELKTNKD